MRPIFISAGHGNRPGRDMGAASGKDIEGVLAERTRQVLAASIRTKGGSVIVDNPSLITIETVKAWKNKISASAIALDLHFNASANSSIDGVECIVPTKPTKLELEIADKISDIVSQVTGTPERGRIGAYDGVKYETETARKQLAWMTLPGSTILVEWQFITDKEALAKFMSNLTIICDKIADYLVALQKTG